MSQELGSARKRRPAREAVDLGELEIGSEDQPAVHGPLNESFGGLCGAARGVRYHCDRGADEERVSNRNVLPRAWQSEANRTMEKARVFSGSVSPEDDVEPTESGLSSASGGRRPRDPRSPMVRRRREATRRTGSRSHSPPKDPPSNRPRLPRRVAGDRQALAHRSAAGGRPARSRRHSASRLPGGSGASCRAPIAVLVPGVIAPKLL